MNPPPKPQESTLYGKILSKEGITGLLLFMFASFLMGIIYQGQQKTIDKLDIQTEILKDIRYAIKAQGGIVFRNDQ